MRPVTETVAESWSNSLDVVCQTAQEPVAIVIMAGIALAIYTIFFRK